MNAETGTAFLKPYRGNSDIKPSMDELTSDLYKKPVHILLFALLLIFGIEALIMLVLILMPYLPIYIELLLDASLLALLTFPILYFFLIKPLQSQINENELLRKKISELSSMPPPHKDESL
jgi:hypothetical protein